MAVVLQVSGLVAVAVGVFLSFGPGAGLIVAGICATVTGVAVERN